jgi:hypothetical protein
MCSVGGGYRSSMPMMSPPLKTTPAELVNTSLRTPVATAAAITVSVPCSLTLKYREASLRPAGGDAVWIMQVVPLYNKNISYDDEHAQKRHGPFEEQKLTAPH